MISPVLCPQPAVFMPLPSLGAIPALFPLQPSLATWPGRQRESGVRLPHASQDGAASWGLLLEGDKEAPKHLIPL